MTNKMTRLVQKKSHQPVLGMVAVMESLVDLICAQFPGLTGTWNLKP